MNMQIGYKPAPINVTNVVLPPELAALGEMIASQVHDTWAEQKISDGWTYGPETDKTAKLHADLIPYENLPETIKTYDRNTAQATLKLLVKLGWQLIPPGATGFDTEVVSLPGNEDRLMDLGKAGYEVKVCYTSAMHETHVILQKALK